MVTSRGQVSDQLEGRSAQLVELVDQLGSIVDAFSRVSDRLRESLGEVNRSMEKTVIAGEQLESTYDQSFATIYQSLAREPGELEGLLNGAVLLKPLMDSLNASTHSTPTEARCSKGLPHLQDK